MLQPYQREHTLMVWDIIKIFIFYLSDVIAYRVTKQILLNIKVLVAYRPCFLYIIKLDINIKTITNIHLLFEYFKITLIHM